MDPKKIERLLEKYFDGTTSLEEEADLRAYFCETKDVPAELQPYQSLFRFFEAEQSLQLGNDFDRRLMEQLADHPAPAPRIRKLRPILARIAAILLVAFGIWWLYPGAEPAPQQASIDWSKYEPETPEEAYRVTRSALMKLSGELADGTRKAAREVDKIEKVGKYMK